MPTADLRYTAFAFDLNPGQTRTLRCDYDDDLTGRTFEAVLDDIDLAVTVDEDANTVTIIFDGADTEELSTRLHHTWYLYDVTAGDDPLQIEFGGPVHLSTRGTELPDASVVVTSRDVTVAVTVLGEPGPPGSAGSGATAEEIQDVVGAMFAGNTETGGSLSYDDPTGKINFAAEVTAAALAAGYQPLDSDLTAIAALSTTAFGRSFLTLANAAAGRTLLALGTAALSATGDFDAAGAAAAAQAASQPLDADLTSIAALTTTPYGRAFLALVDAAAGRTALGLGTAAVAATGDFEPAGAVATAIANLINSAPGALDTLDELAAALGDDANFASTMTTALAGKQPLDADLTAIAALTTTSFGRSLLEAANAAALRSLAGLVLGTDIYSKAAVDAGFQPLDADLTAIAALATTAYGRGLLTDADAAAFTSRLTALLNATYEPLHSAASQAEMEAGTETALRSMSPLRVAQAIDALAADVLPWVNVVDYGAVGDGVADDSAAIQAALDVIAARSGVTAGGTLFLPRGRYKCLTGLTYRKAGLKIQGEGGAHYVAQDGTVTHGGSVLVAGTASMTLLDLYPTSTPGSFQHAGTTIREVHFEDSTGLTATLVHLRYTTNWLIEKCGFFKAAIGISIESQAAVEDTSWGLVENCVVAHNTTGIKTITATDAAVPALTVSHGNYLVPDGGIGIDHSGKGYYTRISGMKFDVTGSGTGIKWGTVAFGSISNVGMECTSSHTGYGIHVAAAAGLTIEGIQFASGTAGPGHTGTGIYLNGDATTKVSGVSILGGVLSSFAKGIHLTQYAHACTIIGTRVSSSNTVGIQLDSGANYNTIVGASGGSSGVGFITDSGTGNQIFGRAYNNTGTAGGLNESKMAGIDASAGDTYDIGANAKFRRVRATQVQVDHVGAATPTGGNSGDIKVGNGVIWVNDAATWRSAPLTAANVLALLLTVDGAGSGLDADLLDGMSSAAFETPAGAQTKADAKVTQTITNGVTTTAPSEDAVFDALSLKAPAANPVFTGTVTIPDGALAIADTSGLQAALDAKAADADVVHDTGDETIAGIKTFSSDPLIPDEAYDATAWNGVLEPPTKNAVRDKIEDILDGVTFTGDVVVPDEAYDATAWNGSLEVPTKNAIRDKIETLGGGTVDVVSNVATDRVLGRDTAGSGDSEELTVGGGIEFTGSGGLQTSALTGDVTKAAGGTATTIAAAAVTNAMLAGSIDQSKILLNDPLGVGFPTSFDPRQAANGAGQIAADVNGCGWWKTIGGGTVTTLAVYVGTASGNIGIAVYGSTGTGRSRVPDTANRKVTTGAVACPASGLGSVSVSSTTIVAATDYFALSTDNTSATVQRCGSNGGAVPMFVGMCARLQSAAHPPPSSGSPTNGSIYNTHFIMGGV